jgi:HEAT repeat protein
MDITNALKDLSTDDPERILPAVDFLASSLAEVVDEVVRGLEGPAGYLVYERLGRFGSLAIRPLERLLEESMDGEARIFAAAAALMLGSTRGLAMLLDALTTQNPYACVAASALSRAGRVEALPVLYATLQSQELQDTNVIECMVAAVKHLGGALPNHVRDRLRTIEPKWMSAGWLD